MFPPFMLIGLGCLSPPSCSLGLVNAHEVCRISPPSTTAHTAHTAPARTAHAAAPRPGFPLPSPQFLPTVLQADMDLRGHFLLSPIPPQLVHDPHYTVRYECSVSHVKRKNHAPSFTRWRKNPWQCFSGATCGQKHPGGGRIPGSASTKQPAGRSTRARKVNRMLVQSTSKV